MSFHLWGPVEEVLDFLGMPMPKGDEDQLFARGQHYSDAHAKTQGHIGELEAIRGVVDRGLTGKAGDAALALIDQNLKALRQEAENLKALAEQCHECAQAIQHTKYVIAGMAAALLIQFGFALFSGVGSLAAAFAILRTRMSIGLALRELLMQIVANVGKKQIAQALAKEAAIGAGLGAGMDLGAQVVQNVEGTRDGLDLKSIGTNALEGGVAGAVGGKIGSKLHGIGGAAASGLGGALAANATDAALTGNLEHIGDGLTGQTALGAITGLAGGMHGQLSSDMRAREAGTGITPDHTATSPRGTEAENTSSSAHDGQNAANGKSPSVEDAKMSAGGGEGHNAPENGVAQKPAAPTDEHTQPGGREHTEEEHPQAVAQQTTNPLDVRTEGRSPAEQPQRQGQQPATPGADRANQTTGQPPASAPTERAPAGASLSGENRPSPTSPRAEAPVARLSSSGAEPVRDQHAGAAATTRDTPAPAARHAEPAAVKPAEQVRALADAPAQTEKHAAATSTEKALADASTASHRPDTTGVVGREHQAVEPHGESGAVVHHLVGEPGGVGPGSAVAETRGSGILDTQARQHYRDVLDGAKPLHEGDWPSDHAREQIEKIWGGLNDAEKQALFKIAPMVGEHAHVPVPECDHRAQQAARELRAELLDYKRTVGWSERLQERLDALDDILRSVEPKPNSPRRYLLGFEHDGRNIVSVGNPDRAARTLVFTPGTFSGHAKLNFAKGEAAGWFKRLLGLPGKSDVAGYANVSERFWWSMKEAAGHDDVAVVCWQNYHAPQSLGLEGAARKHFAIDGADRLRDHTQRLAATNQRPDSSTTVTGHSYGNAVVGQAAMHPDGLHADAILALSAPGMGVKDLTGLVLKGQHLGLGDARFHSIIHENDVLIPACRAGLDIGDFGHNRMPHTEAFGAAPEQNHIIEYKDAPYSVFNFDGHRSPFDENRHALQLIGQIAVGVEPVHFPQKTTAHAPGFENNPQLHHDLANVIETSDLRGSLEQTQQLHDGTTKAIAVLPEREHVEKTRQLIADLESSGYKVKYDSGGWEPGTKHRHIDLISPDGRDVRLEVNTRMGLDAGAQAKDLRALARQPGLDPKERARLRQLADDVFDAIVEPGRSAA